MLRQIIMVVIVAYGQGTWKGVMIGRRGTSLTLL